jgi:calcium-dependent protein kinase
MFEKMDLNKDQMLSFEELKLGLHKFGQQMRHVSAIDL